MSERAKMVAEVVSVAREELIGRLGRAPKAAEIIAFVPVSYRADVAKLLK